MDNHPADFIILMTTCGSDEEANRLTSILIEKRLAACVQASTVISTYRWHGVVETTAEVRLIIKARASDYSGLEELIRLNHSYVNPEIIAVPIVAGSEIYLDWLREETRRD